MLWVFHSLWFFIEWMVLLLVLQIQIRCFIKWVFMPYLIIILHLKVVYYFLVKITNFFISKSLFHLELTCIWYVEIWFHSFPQMDNQLYPNHLSTNHGAVGIILHFCLCVFFSSLYSVSVPYLFWELTITLSRVVW